jgi:hypothetical protein
MVTQNLPSGHLVAFNRAFKKVVRIDWRWHEDLKKLSFATLKLKKEVSKVESRTHLKKNRAKLKSHKSRG